MDDVLRVEHDERGVATVTLHRPESRNALSPALMTALVDAFTDLADHPGLRLVVLTGSGEVFCAGGDLHWMREGRDRSRADHERDSARLDRVFQAIDTFPAPVVGRMNGHAIAGGTGLLCGCDVVVAVRGAKMGFTEVRLGIAPATISRIVLPKIGPAAARRWFLTGELFDTEAATSMGLVHEVVERDELDDAVEDVVDALLRGAPRAQRRTKELIRTVWDDPDGAADVAVPLIAELRVADEGQEGIAAFFDRRPPAWSPDAGRDARPDVATVRDDGGSAGGADRR